MIAYILIFLSFIVLAWLIPWRNRRVSAYRVEKLNSRQALPVISPALLHSARAAGSPRSEPRLKAVQ